MDDFVSQFEVAVRVILRNLRHYMKLLWPYIGVVIVFIAFVVINKGIVVGQYAV